VAANNSCPRYYTEVAPFRHQDKEEKKREKKIVGVNKLRFKGKKNLDANNPRFKIWRKETQEKKAIES
jgi:hypothetical protein